MKLAIGSGFCWPAIFALLALSTPFLIAAEAAPARLDLEVQVVGAPATAISTVARATAAELADPAAAVVPGS